VTLALVVPNLKRLLQNKRLPEAPKSL